MSDVPVRLDPVLVDLFATEYEEILRWPFADPFVSRLLRDDLADRARLGRLQFWVFRNTEAQSVGFGTLDLSLDHAGLASGRFHPYIPLLAVNPTIPSRGYGTQIMQHLIGQAAVMTRKERCDPRLFLDVYTTSIKAIALYQKVGFVRVNDEPIPDPLEGGLTYHIMARGAATISQGAPVFIEGH